MNQLLMSQQKHHIEMNKDLDKHKNEYEDVYI